MTDPQAKETTAVTQNLNPPNLKLEDITLLPLCVYPAPLIADYVASFLVIWHSAILEQCTTTMPGLQSKHQCLS
jgi:hypothetical protein